MLTGRQRQTCSKIFIGLVHIHPSAERCSRGIQTIEALLTPARAWKRPRDPEKNGRTTLHSIADRLFSLTQAIGPCRTCSPAQILDILTLHMSSTSSLICTQHRSFNAYTVHDCQMWLCPWPEAYLPCVGFLPIFVRALGLQSHCPQDCSKALCPCMCSANLHLACPLEATNLISSQDWKGCNAI